MNILEELSAIENKCNNVELRKIIKQAISSLDETEQYILIHKFGLLGNNTKTINEIAKEINKTKCNCYYIEKKAIKKLKFNLINKLNFSLSLLNF